MKIIHTADWHLGQSFYEYDRKTEHSGFLTWLRKTAKEYGADILLIAGDIFDSPNPSAESQRMYFSFLREITNENPELQIIITAGNHDSAARLEAPNPLLENMNITVRGVVKRDGNGEILYERLIIPLNKGGYCLAVPYLRQGDYPDAGNYSKSVKALYDKLYEMVCKKSADHINNHHSDKDVQPVIAMGHLQATGSEISENDRSERTIIGGLECVSPETFSENISYTALGHLHRGQRVSGRENIRYSGTPIPMSFAERNNKQGVVLVEINRAGTVPLHTEESFHGTDGNMTGGIQADKEAPATTRSAFVKKGRYIIQIENLRFEGVTRFISLPETPMPLDDVLREIQKLPVGEVTDTSPYLEIKVLITEPEPSMRHRIEDALKNKAVRLARVSAGSQGNKKEQKTATLEELQTTNPADLAEKLFEQQYGCEKMPETMKKLLLEVIQEIER